MNLNPVVRPIALLALAPGAAFAWTPGSSDPDATTGLAVDITLQNDVAAFYQCIYKASEGSTTADPWVTGMEGSIINCSPGATTASYREQVQRRVNYYRAMAQLPASVAFTSTQNDRAQAAAFATSENDAVNHGLTSADTCLTGSAASNAATGSADGNLALGTRGAGAVDFYIESFDPSETPTGDPSPPVQASDTQLARYRRWVLERSTTEMGTGDFEGGSASSDAHSLYVANTSNPASPPSVDTDNFASWPPGIFRFSTENEPQPSSVVSYVPADLVSGRWSFQFGRVDPSAANAFQQRIMFVNAFVEMYVNGSPLKQSAPDTLGVYGKNALDAFGKEYGGPAISWDPDWSDVGGAPPVGSTIRVDVRSLGDVKNADGEDIQNVSYNIILTDPEKLSDQDTFQIVGPTTVDNTGGTFFFAPASPPGAEKYELRAVRQGDGLTTVTDLGTNQLFAFNSASAGAALSNGQVYNLSIIPTVGGHAFPPGQVFTVSVVSTDPTFSDWVSTNFPGIPAGMRGFGDDPDEDTHTNGIEYAFGLDPTDPTDAPPSFTVGPAGSTLVFDPSTRGYPTTDIGIRLMTSADLTSWTPLAPGSDGITYTVPASTPRFFYQWEVSELAP